MAAADDDPGRLAARLVQRAAEILGEELGAARARGAGRAAPSSAATADPSDPADQARRDLVEDLRDAAGTVVERLVEAVDAIVGVTARRPGGESTPGPTDDTARAPGGGGDPGGASDPAPAPAAVGLHLAHTPVAPGSTATITLGLPPDPVGGRRGPIVASALLGPGRGRIPARAVTWTPERIEDAGPEGVVVRVAVPPATRAGEYRMLLRGPSGFEAVVGVVVGR